MRRAAVTDRASFSVFIETQELSHFNYTDNSSSDPVTACVNGKVPVLLQLFKTRRYLSQYQIASYWDKYVSTRVLPAVTEV